MPTKLQHFHVATKVEFLPTKSKKRTLMEIVALDTPGLLSTIAHTFIELNLDLHAAKITTIGERAEDLFILTCHEGGQLNTQQQQQLQKTLIETLSSPTTPPS